MASVMDSTSGIEQAMAVLTALLEEERVTDHPPAPGSRLCTELGVCGADLDEIYFAALDRLGRRPPMDETEVRFEANLNDPTLEELARHLTLNCPEMTEADRAAASVPSDPPPTTRGEAGLTPPSADNGITASRASLGFAALLFIVAIIALVWMVTGT